MFSALKKLTSKQDVNEKTLARTGVPMSNSLQKKFSRGVNYNMKIIIKGDRNVGKSCLFKRLQGGNFLDVYVPTEEIQVASIQWSFKATEDIVKVEVWDVVDKGKGRHKLSGLKLKDAAILEAHVLDADFLDVYKGTHGVILVMDITKSWTFDYIQRELLKTPSDLPVLLLGNHCDMAHHRVISVGLVQDYVEKISIKQSEVIYAESSMRNGFGLRLLHKFLGLPFLRLQKETYIALLERNKQDAHICGYELNEFLNSDEADYSHFLTKLIGKRKQVADLHSKNSKSITISSNTTTCDTIQKKHSLVNIELYPTKSIVGDGPDIISDTEIINKNSTFLTKTKKTEIFSHVTPKVIKTLQNISLDNKKIESVEEFCPDEEMLDKNFLEDITIVNVNIPDPNINDSDSDIENNPMVATFDEEPKTGVKNSFEKSSLKYLDNVKNHQSLKENPLAKNKKSGSIKNLKHDIKKNALATEDFSKVLPSHNSFKSDYEINSQCWTSDLIVRRSPEGGEDNVLITHVSQDCEPDSINSETNFNKKKIKKDKINLKKKKKKKDQKTQKDEAYEAI